jgi:hypothetical protein
MNAVEDYAKRWAKRESKELDTLSEWVKSVRGILKSRIRNILFNLKYVPSILLCLVNHKWLMK